MVSRRWSAVDAAVEIFLDCFGFFLGDGAVLPLLFEKSKIAAKKGDVDVGPGGLKKDKAAVLKVFEADV